MVVNEISESEISQPIKFLAFLFLIKHDLMICGRDRNYPISSFFENSLLNRNYSRPTSLISDFLLLEYFSYSIFYTLPSYFPFSPELERFEYFLWIYER